MLANSKGTWSPCDVHIVLRYLCVHLVLVAPVVYKVARTIGGKQRARHFFCHFFHSLVYSCTNSQLKSGRWSKTWASLRQTGSSPRATTTAKEATSKTRSERRRAAAAANSGSTTFSCRSTFRITLPEALTGKGAKAREKLKKAV